MGNVRVISRTIHTKNDVKSGKCSEKLYGQIKLGTELKFSTGKMAKNKAFRSLFKAKIMQKKHVIHRKIMLSTWNVEKCSNNPQNSGYINKKYRNTKRVKT